jgi:hypothetical protein
MDRSTGYRIRQVLLSLAFILTLLFSSQVNAILIQAIPDASDVAIGETFRVDIIVLGLEEQTPHEVVRGYHLDVAYAPEVAIATDVVFGDMLGLYHPLAGIFQHSQITNDYIMLEEVSLWSDSTLGLAQPDSFMLASIGFVATDLGTVTFDFLPYLDFGIDVKGRGAQLLPIEAARGSVNISSASVPEPTSIMLFGLGLLGIALTKIMKRVRVIQ